MRSIAAARRVLQPAPKLRAEARCAGQAGESWRPSPTVQAASAADMPVKAYKAPVAAPAAFSWTGCYIGAHAGYGWGRNRNNFNDAIRSDPTEGPGPEGTNFPAEYASFDHNTNGGVLGGQAGCNYQFQQNWVVGVEGEFAWSGIKGSLTNPEDAFDPGQYSSFESKNLWNGDIALRLGYAWDRSLLYGKVGAAFGSFRYTETHDDFPSTPLCATVNGVCSVSFTNTRAGLLLGAGWEYAFTNNWTGKVEYDYINYGSANIPYPDAAVVPPVAVQVRDSVSIVKVGVNYLFR
jgi:outer membrane immunogenic protein